MRKSQFSNLTDLNPGFDGHVLRHDRNILRKRHLHIASKKVLRPKKFSGCVNHFFSVLLTRIMVKCSGPVKVINLDRSDMFGTPNLMQNAVMPSFNYILTKLKCEMALPV